MSKFKYKYQMYKHLQANIPTIYAEAKKASEELNIPAELKGKFGLTGGISGCPAPMRDDIMEAGEASARVVTPLAVMVEELRGLVKDLYGDEYDCAPCSTCEAGLWVAFDTLFTPPSLGRGDNYRTRYLVPLEKHLHHQGGYGRPFPPRYKDILADRGCTAGELGFYGKRQNNLDALMVPLSGANYAPHGIKYHPVPLLTKVNADETYAIMHENCLRNATMLSGITSLGYETPGYGYGAKDKDGTPLLQKMYAKLAKEFNVPYVVDNAWGVPGIGHDPRKSGADVVIYSMDKASGAATSGLMIGKEEVMVSIRRAMGMHGDRWGTGASYGKAAYVAFDPGKEAIATQIQALKVLRDNPKVLTDSIDDLYDVVVEEFAKIHPTIKKGLIITKSHNSRAVEINYENTWNDGLGLPIFSIEDMYSGTNIFQSGMAQMGIIPTIAYDGNIYMSPDLGTTDSKGKLLKDVTRLAVRGQVLLIEIVARSIGMI